MEFDPVDTTHLVEARWPEGAVLRRDVVEGYTIVREIGRGATGAVYLAHENATQQPVAIKFLSARLGEAEECLTRWSREAEILERLQSPHIVRGIAHGETQNRHFFIMEFVMGETLAALLRRRGRLHEPEALDIAEAIASALEAAHASRVIHRDVKPANIIRDRDHTVKLMDFGLAREEMSPSVTAHGMILGTPIYVSPEQARGERELDIRTDIYSLGITLFHMLAGEPPFTEFNTSLLLTKKITDDIPDVRRVNPDVTPAAAQLVQRMCLRDRQRRIATPAELLLAIAKVRQGELLAAAHTWAGQPSPPPKSVAARIAFDPVMIESPSLRQIVQNERFPSPTRFLDANEVLFYEDDTSRECYVLLLGRLEILKAGRQIAIVEKAGAFVGEMSALLNAPRTATPRALEPSVLLQLSEDLFRAFLREAPDLGWELAVTLAQRLEHTNQKVRDTMTRLQHTRDVLRDLRMQIGE